MAASPLDALWIRFLLEYFALFQLTQILCHHFGRFYWRLQHYFRLPSVICPKIRHLIVFKRHSFLHAEFFIVNTLHCWRYLLALEIEECNVVIICPCIRPFFTSFFIPRTSPAEALLICRKFEQLNSISSSFSFHLKINIIHFKRCLFSLLNNNNRQTFY